MFIDNSTFMADALSTTTSVASTNYIDTLAAGDAYVGAWVVVRIDDAFVAKNGAPQTVFQLQGSETNTFTTDGVTLGSSSTMLVAALTADTIVWKVRIPVGAPRYLRVYKLISNYSAGVIDITSGSWDAFVVQDVDISEVPGA